MINGYNLHRHKSNPKEKEFHDKFNDIVLHEKYHYQMLDKIIFGTKDMAQQIPKEELSERERDDDDSFVIYFGVVGDEFK